MAQKCQRRPGEGGAAMSRFPTRRPFHTTLAATIKNLNAAAARTIASANGRAASPRASVWRRRIGGAT